jgi:hypothetical protein
VFNNDFLTDLARERVVPFLGAGVSASASIDGRPAYLDWKNFLLSVAKTRAENLRDQIKNLIESNDFLLACQLLQDECRDDWQTFLANEYGKDAEPSELHRAILALSQRLIVTTNFDKLIETAWPTTKEKFLGGRSLKVLSFVDQTVFKCLKDFETPYLIKLHGSIDIPEKLIFSLESYIKMAFGNERYSSFFESVLINYTVLFIGFSMRDPAILSLMEMYAHKYPHARPHYILSSQSQPENIRVINMRFRKLIAIEYQDDNNHEALPRILSELREGANQKRRDLVAQMSNSSLNP